MMKSRFARLPESDRALRDGSFGWRFPRHFVPGYDRLSLRDALADISQQHELEAALRWLR
jgi:hypothetical protein